MTNLPRAQVLVVEDEPLLRQSVVAGLAKLDRVSVSSAGSVGEAVVSIDAQPPDVVVSDIDLPGRLGIELLGELGARGLRPHVIFVSAYVKAFRAQIPRNPRVEVVEKPVSLEVLRRLVVERMLPGDELSPFGLADYLQVAGLGHHSVLLEVSRKGLQGTVEVVQGEAWSARDDRGEGLAAFRRLVEWPDATVRCLSLREPSGARTLEGSIEGLLLEAFRLRDEATARKPAAPAAPPRREIPPSLPPPSLQIAEEGATDDAAFDAVWERALQAALARDHAGALAAFREAQALRPADKMVRANLLRLEALLEKDGQP